MSTIPDRSRLGPPLSEKAGLLWDRIRFHVALCEVACEDGRPDTGGQLIPAGRVRDLFLGLYRSRQVKASDRRRLLAELAAVAPKCKQLWASAWPWTFPKT